jgi:uncharacterized protein (TIGR00369 family)
MAKLELDMLRQLMEELIPFNRHLGIKVTLLSEGFTRLELPFRPEFVGDPTRPALHGGLMSTLADTAGGMAIWTTGCDDRTRVSTIDLRVDYLRPGRLATLVAEGQVVRAGNRVGVADVRLFHPDAPDATVATGKGVYNIKNIKPKTEP